MGSLMPGWSTSPRSPNDAMKRSASSLTKEEVEKFWRTKRMLMQEHLDEANKDAALSPRIEKGMAEVFNSQDQAGDAGGLSMSLPSSIAKPAWWTKSNWAFLNDPPTVESKQTRYVAQFDVALKGQADLDSERSLPSFS